jgi:predicted ATPase
MDRLTNSFFVGRERELAELRANLEEAGRGRGRLFFLAGEPGIGKTRLAEEFAVCARQLGARAFWGRCWEGDGAPAFWPWVQIARAYLRQCDVDTWLADLGPGAAVIAQVVTEVRERLPHLPALPELDPAQARFRFFDSFTRFLLDASHRQPLVAILDDLHWADIPSLLLLQFLAREVRDSRLLVIGTYRDAEVGRAHPLSAALGTLTRESQCVVLGNLDAREVGRLIEGTTGVKPAAGLVKVVHEKTEGNPFFVGEVVRLLAADARSLSAEGETARGLSTPHGVREAVRRRLGRLSSACQRLLAVAAVIGREFTLDLLARVGGESISSDTTPLLGLLDEALAARVLGEAEGGVARYRFAHALIRETLYEDLSLPERTRLHRQIGETLEALHGTNLAPHLAALADHFFKAAPGGTVGKALTYAAEAGGRAVALLAYEEAVTHYQRALQVAELQEPDATRRCQLLLDLGDAQAKAGDLSQARATLRQAAALARQLVTPGGTPQAASLLARAALSFGGAWVGTGTGVADEPLVDLLEGALAALGWADSPLRARVLARLASELRWVAPHEQRAALSRQAVAMARRLGDGATLAYTLSARHWALWEPDNVEERRAVTTEIIRLAERTGDKALALQGHTWHLTALLELGDIAAVGHATVAVTRLAAELQQPFYLWWSTGLRVMRVLLAGRFAEVEQLAEQALLIGQRVQAPDALQAFGAQMATLRGEQGRLHELAPAIQAFAEQHAAVPAWQGALAHLHAELGQHEEARRAFERLAAHGFTDLPRDQQWLTTLVLLAEVCTFLGDTARAAVLYELLLPYAARNVVVGPAVACYGSASRTLGLLASTTARWDEAARHFEDALAMNVRMGARPFVARTQFEYARMLLRRDLPGDHARALELLASASATARELGMTSLQSKVCSPKPKVEEPATGGRKKRKTLGTQGSALRTLLIFSVKRVRTGLSVTTAPPCGCGTLRASITSPPYYSIRGGRCTSWICSP